MIRVVESSSAADGRSVVAQSLIAGRPSTVGLAEVSSKSGRQLVAAGVMGPRSASEDLVVLAAAVGVLA